MQVSNVPSQDNSSTQIQFKPVQVQPQKTQESPTPQEMRAEQDSQARVYTAERDTVAELRKKPDVSATEAIKTQAEAQKLVDKISQTIAEDKTQAVQAQGNVNAQNVVAMLR